MVREFFKWQNAESIKPDAEETSALIFKHSSTQEQRWEFASSFAASGSAFNREVSSKELELVEPKWTTPNRDTVAGLALANLWVSKMNLFGKMWFLFSFQNNKLKINFLLFDSCYRLILLLFNILCILIFLIFKIIEKLI